MASDWIKMRTDLYRDPKVCCMAEFLFSEEQREMGVTRNALRNVMRNATVGALVAVWGVARHRGKRINDDLVIRGATISVIDDIAELPGFGDAMAKVEWAQETDEGIVFPSFFEEFNVEPTYDKKNSNAERQKRFREKSNALRNVTRNAEVTPNSNDREEKRREEIKKPPLPPKGGVEEHRHFAEFWKAYPRKVKRPDAVRAFAKIDPGDELLASILAAIESQKRWPQWTKDGGQFIPHPASWLNAQAWNDQPPENLRPVQTTTTTIYDM